jgi:hypothetical protein
MLWQAVVLAMQILLLAVGWYLFQLARAELSARAAEMPVLSEVKALHRGVKQLLAEIERTAERTSADLEARFAQGAALLESLDQALTVSAQPLETVPALPAPSPRRSAGRRGAKAKAEVPDAAATVVVIANDGTEEPGVEVESAHETRRRTVYRMADAGTPAADIARNTGLSEGEIETLLGLRGRRR